MKKLLKVSALALGLGLASSAAMAQDIGVVNMQYLMMNHPERVATFEKVANELKQPEMVLKKEQDELGKRIQAFQQEVQAKKTAFEKDAAKLTPAQVKKHQEELDTWYKKSGQELQQAEATFQQKVMAFNAGRNQAEQTAVKSLIDSIKKATQEVAKAKHIDMVLAENAAVVVPEKSDLTQDVLKQLEKAKKAK